LRLDGAGNRLDAQAIGVAKVSYNSAQSIALASNGKDYLMVWVTYQGGDQPLPFNAIRIGGDGTLLDASPITVGSDITNRVEAAFTGTNYLVAWAGSSGLRARCVSTEGKLLGTAPIQVTTKYGPLPHLAPAPNGVAMAVNTGGFRMVRFDGDCRADPQETSVSTLSGNGCGLAWSGKNYLLLAASSPTTGEGQLMAQALSNEFKPMGGVLTLGAISASANTEACQARATWDGRSFLVAWTESPLDFGGDIRLAQVSEDGKLLDTGPRYAGASTDSERNPILTPMGPGRALLAYTRDDSTLPYQTRRIRLRDWNADLQDVDGGAPATPDARPANTYDSRRDSLPRDSGFPTDPVPGTPGEAGASTGRDATVDRRPTDGTMDPRADSADPSGLPDSGPPGPVTPSVTTQASSGCGCTTVPSHPSAFSLFMLAGLVVRFGRRRRVPVDRTRQP
jgi:MYXO-CTERM domain-containing protein